MPRHSPPFRGDHWSPRGRSTIQRPIQRDLRNLHSPQHRQRSPSNSSRTHTPPPRGSVTRMGNYTSHRDHAPLYRSTPIGNRRQDSVNTLTSRRTRNNSHTLSSSPLYVPTEYSSPQPSVGSRRSRYYNSTTRRMTRSRSRSAQHCRSRHIAVAPVPKLLTPLEITEPTPQTVQPGPTIFPDPGVGPHRP
jgi:hypothetical protein